MQMMVFSAFVHSIPFHVVDFGRLQLITMSEFVSASQFILRPAGINSKYKCSARSRQHSCDYMCAHCVCVSVWAEHVKLTVHLEQIILNEAQHTSHMCLLSNKHKEKRCANDTLRHNKASSIFRLQFRRTHFHLICECFFSLYYTQIRWSDDDKVFAIH